MRARLHRWSVLTTLWCVAQAFAAEPTTLRFMTYNIRLDIASDGANAWPHRREWVAAQVRWLRPDLFGLQEVVPGQKADLIADLPGYRFFGDGRDAGGAGESSPIGFDAKKLRLIAGGMFWLSPTPAVSSKGWDAAHPRIVTWVRLQTRDSRLPVLAINTHWDHIGVDARRQSAAQMLRWIQANARRCERVVVLGDFNTVMDSEPLRVLTDDGLLRDARAAAKSPPFGPRSTFNGFELAASMGGAIDHVLVGDHVEVLRYAVFAQSIDGRVPSDHYPVLVDLTFTPCR